MIGCRSLCRGSALLVAGAAAGILVGMNQEGMGHDRDNHMHQPGEELDPQEMMAQWMAMNQPGAEHKGIARLAGTWDYVSKFWMEPGGEPNVSRGTQTNELVLGGRYLTMRPNGPIEFPGPDGELMTVPFEGLGVFGYDTMNKTYVYTWMDNFSTGIYTYHGDASADGDTYTLRGNAQTPWGEFRQRQVTRITGEDSYVIEMYETWPGEDEMRKTGEIAYTRAF